MFTGLIEALGQVQHIEEVMAPTGGEPLRRLALQTPWRGPQVPAIGASVAVDGVCLTVTQRDAKNGALRMEVAAETRRRTTLGQVGTGAVVHLERALRFGDRLDGHLVSGHVDGVGTVRQAHADGSAWHLAVQVPPAVAALSAAQGAITLAGVSLTIVGLQGDLLWVGLVPHTMQCTTLGQLQPGDAINCEADWLARYVARLLPAAQRGQSGGAP